MFVKSDMNDLLMLLEIDTNVILGSLVKIFSKEIQTLNLKVKNVLVKYDYRIV